jgi:hypothetical protein
MKAAKVFFLITGIVASLMLVAGLFRPYALLWWKAVQTRRGVIRIYGLAMAISFIIYSILRFVT